MNSLKEGTPASSEKILIVHLFCRSEKSNPFDEHSARQTQEKIVRHTALSAIVEFFKYVTQRQYT